LIGDFSLWLRFAFLCLWWWKRRRLGLAGFGVSINGGTLCNLLIGWVNMWASEFVRESTVGGFHYFNSWILLMPVLVAESRQLKMGRQTINCELIKNRSFSCLFKKLLY